MNENEATDLFRLKPLRGSSLPWFAGWQRLGVAAWLDAPRNRQAAPDGTVHADLAALVCRGPVDALTHLWIDGQEVWNGLIARGDEQSIAISLGDWGAGTLFWGRADQDFQPDLQAAGHPAYRGQCYLYLPQFRLAADGASAPRVELALRRAPVVPWLTGTDASLDGDANPAHALAEWLSDPVFGAGLSAEDFDQAQWAACAAQLAVEGAGCSPQVDQPTDPREFAAELCECFGGFLRWTPAGKLRLGLRRDLTSDPAELPRLTASHLTRPAEIVAGGWSEIFSRTAVLCRERTRGWAEDFGQWSDDGGARIEGQPRTQIVARRWITQRAVAAALASRLGKLAALPQCTGRLQARASAAGGIDAGDWFVLDAGVAGPMGAALIMQCNSRRMRPDTTAVELEVTGRRL